MSTPPPAWMDQAVCAQLVTDGGMDPEAWTGDPDHPDRPLALAACDRCPVAADCAQAGRREEWGIWGGVTATYRRKGPRTPKPRRPEPPGPDGCVNATEAMRLLGVTRNGLRWLVDKGDLTVAAQTVGGGVHGGRKNWYRRTDIERLAQQRDAS